MPPSYVLSHMVAHVLRLSILDGMEAPNSSGLRDQGLMEVYSNTRKKMNVGDSPLLIFTGVVAASTVFYAVLTRQLVIETRRLREVQTEPRVSVRVETDHTGRHGYELTISNEGQGVAKNVRFAFEGDSSYFRNSWAGRTPPELNELSVIKMA